MSKTDKKKPDEKVDEAIAYSENFFKNNKEFHLNYEKTTEAYLVSSGSILVDDRIGGGFHSGLLRFTGCNEGGKTAEALEILKNALNNIPKARGLYVKAEGRLSENVRLRSGLRLVHDPKDWVDGTCLVFECNVFDTVFDFIRGLFKNNKDKNKYFIAIDSMDGLLLKSDLSKDTGEASKVAGGALLSSDFLKRVSLGMSKFGHLCIMISQVRSKVSIDPYAKADTNNQTSASGGNASLHYPDWIFEFQRQYQDDFILEDPSAKFSSKNKKIGHYAKVRICKSTNETTGQIIRYPIIYGRINGRSIWVEREIVEMLVMWGFVEKTKAGSSWYVFDPEFRKFCEEEKVELPKSIQGLNKIYEYFESNENSTTVARNFVAIEILKK